MDCRTYKLTLTFIVYLLILSPLPLSSELITRNTIEKNGVTSALVSITSCRNDKLLYFTSHQNSHFYSLDSESSEVRMLKQLQEVSCQVSCSQGSTTPSYIAILCNNNQIHIMKEPQETNLKEDSRLRRMEFRKIREDKITHFFIGGSNLALGYKPLGIIDVYNIELGRKMMTVFLAYPWESIMLDFQGNLLIISQFLHFIADPIKRTSTEFKFSLPFFNSAPQVNFQPSLNPEYKITYMLSGQNKRAFFHLTQDDYLTDLVLDYSFHLDGHQIVAQKYCRTFVVHWFQTVLEFQDLKYYFDPWGNSIDLGSKVLAASCSASHTESKLFVLTAEKIITLVIQDNSYLHGCFLAFLFYCITNCLCKQFHKFKKSPRRESQAHLLPTH